MMEWLKALWSARGVSLPFYVTRKDADGRIGYFSINALWGLALLLMSFLAMTLGLVVAIVTCVMTIVGWF